LKVLLDRRNSWYQAYFSGDIEALKELESTDFIFVSSDGVEHSENRYEILQGRLDRDDWFEPGTRIVDSTITVKELGDHCAFISGLSETYVDDKGLGEVSFSEVWCKRNDRWLVESLHVS